MENKDLIAAMGKPQVLRLKQLGTGIMVGKVLGSRVLVKTVVPRTEMDGVEERTGGMIKIPDFVKKENTPLPTTGIVIQVGPDVPMEFSHFDQDLKDNVYKPTVKEGDMIMFPKFSGSDFRIEEEDLRILDAREILCTLVDTQEIIKEVLPE